MNEEEKKAVGLLKALNNLEKKCKIEKVPYNKSEIKKIMISLLPEDYGIFEILLNLIEKLQKENEELKNDYEKLNLKSIEQQKEIEKKDKQLKGLEEIDKRRTWTVNKVISEYIPDYEIISLINRYKDESFIPRVEVEKILNDRKK